MYILCRHLFYFMAVGFGGGLTPSHYTEKQESGEQVEVIAHMKEAATEDWSFQLSWVLRTSFKASRLIEIRSQSRSQSRFWSLCNLIFVWRFCRVCISGEMRYVKTNAPNFWGERESILETTKNVSESRKPSNGEEEEMNSSTPSSDKNPLLTQQKSCAVCSAGLQYNDES